jgi:hypothetical protein
MIAPEVHMHEFNWRFAAALLGPLTVMIAVYCFGLSQEGRSVHDGNPRKERPEASRRQFSSASADSRPVKPDHTG